MREALTGRAAPTSPASADGEDRALGCLVGLAVGDALGTTLEFTTRDAGPQVTDIVGGGPFRLQAGEWTDDTSMALCLGESLLVRGGLDPLDLMERFRGWRDEGHNAVNGRCFDIGITTRAAIDRYVATGEPLCGATDARAAGNGSIMRLAPVPIFHAADPDAAEAAGVLQSRTTHGAPECLDSCRLMSRVLVALLQGQAWRDAVAVDPATVAAARVQRLAGGDWRGKRRDAIRSGGYVIDTLEAALWAVDATDSFEAAVLLAVNLGDDADTVGAVTGQLAGARYGLAGIAPAWRGKLAWYDRIVAMAQALHAASCAPRR